MRSPALHRKPCVEEQRVVVVCVQRRTIEFIVVGVLQCDAHVGPWPYGGTAAAERDISDFGNIAVAVRVTCGVWRLATIQGGIQSRVRRSPRIEILAAKHDPVVVAVGQRGVPP